MELLVAPPPISHVSALSMHSCAAIEYRVVRAGGMVVCSGPGCSVTFSEVAFERCTVVAVGGATVTLSGCTFSLDPFGLRGLAVLASGATTTVHMLRGEDKGCTISGGLQGVCVPAGAHLSAADVTLEKVSVAGMEVSGEGSRLELDRCNMSSFPRLQRVAGQGVNELDGPKGGESFNLAVAVRNRSSARLKGLKVHNKEGCGVSRR